MNKDKLVKNEQIIRNRNRGASSALKKYFGHKKEVINAPIEFVCECSDMECMEPVIVSIAEYEKIHKRDDRFLIVKGHKAPKIEKIVKDKGHFEVVEKPSLAA